METNWRYDDGRGKGYDENFDMLIWDRGGMGGMEPPSMEDLLIFKISICCQFKSGCYYISRSDDVIEFCGNYIVLVLTRADF